MTIMVVMVVLVLIKDKLVKIHAYNCFPVPHKGCNGIGLVVDLAAGMAVIRAQRDSIRSQTLNSAKYQYCYL